MDKRQSQGIENMGMHLFVSGHSFAALVATIFCGMLAFYFLKKRKKSAEKESTRGASAPSFLCSTPTEGDSDQYDVFLSFRGSYTSNKFPDHLYNSLVNAGITMGVFRDKDSIPVGEEFDSQILGAITRSKISIPIICENYASSKWCLHELVHMMELKKSGPHIVLPIFYKVKPADVRRLQGKFGEALCSSIKYFDQKEIPKYERALEEVCYLQAWESEKIADGREGELVEVVVKTVLNKFPLDVPEHLVGLDYHVKNIRNWVDSPATHARMIGIYGMGGIGKTTLAKVIYNELSKDFMDRSYLPDIRDTTGRKGIPYVQSQLIKDILPDEQEVSEVDRGIRLIKSRFKFRKVLILLDDIGDGEQLHALAGERDWFMAGSIIIVTTRNKCVLHQSRVDLKYAMEKLDMDCSLLLFCKHAFGMDCCRRRYEDISCEIVSIVGGLPLLLEVIGSYLFRKTDLNIWKDMLEQLKKQPHEDVQAILKISYDALRDEHKEIFLDIACFFIGKKGESAMYMWDDCGFHASQGIEELRLRCLIKIGYAGELRMHDQMRDLGRSIVGQGLSPGRRNRLWLYEEASTMLMEKKGTQWVEAISLGEYLDDPSPGYGQLQEHINEQFKDLESLRFLELGRAALRDFTKQFSKLRWLWWSGIEPKPFPATNLHLPNLLVLQTSRNGIAAHWGGWSLVAKRLKALTLAYCGDLKCTPDLSAFPELEVLILNGCPYLEQIHPSIGEVKSLVSLKLTRCSRLRSLPNLPSALINLEISWGGRTLPQLSYLINLQELDLSLCSDLISLPKLPSRLLKLRLTDCCSLILSNKLDGLEYLEELSIQSCDSIERLDLSQLYRLKRLRAKDCSALVEIKGLGNLRSLEEIVVDNPETITRLQGLKLLKADCCDELIKIRGSKFEVLIRRRA